MTITSALFMPFKSSKGTLRAFDRLGAAILAHWRKSDFDSLAFPEVASACLLAGDDATHVTFREIVKWVLTSTSMPRQADLSADFGEPPLTMYFHPRFRIDVLCWNTATTSIHQHGFSGAFRVLQGSSVQAHFRFRLDDRVNDHLHIGLLSLDNLRLLRPGTVEPILSGDRLIHAVYHLESPTLTLVVRTHTDPASSPQFSYTLPGLAVDPFFRDPLEQRRLQMLELLAATQSPAHWKTWAAEAVEQSTVHGSFEVLNLAKTHLEGEPDLYDYLLRYAEAKHGSRLRLVAAAVDQRARLQIVHKLRSLVRDPRHRLFIASALYSPDLRTVIELVGRAYPENNPRELIATWIRELAIRNVVAVERSITETIVRAGGAGGRAVELLRIDTRDDLAALMAA